MSPNSISVIIPAHNAGLSLSAAVESARGQTRPPAEIIIVNDGSTDETSSVAKGFGDRIILREQTNAGQGAARNVGLGIATGEFIAFLDADDYWKPTFLERCTRFLSQHPEAVAVSTGLVVKFFDGTERVLPSCLHQPAGPKSELVLDDFYGFWAREDHVRTGSNLIRRSVIQKAGFQRGDLRVSQDLEYWGYIATFGKWGFIPEPLWVGNSRSVAANSGWNAKYRARRRLCPTVEAWQERILPRLKDTQMPAFRTIRGRVAAAFAHNKILSGDNAEALEIVHKYGATMPSTSLTRLLSMGAQYGKAGWWAACWIVRARESLKYLNVSWVHGRVQ